MIGFDTNKKYVLLEHIWCAMASYSTPLTFGDTKDELVNYCNALGYDPVDIFAFDHKEYMILPTEEYIQRMDNIAYSKYIESTLCKIEDTKISDQSKSENLNYVDITNLNVGDEIVVPHDEYGDILFTVIGKNHDAPNTITILSKNILELLPFDAMEYGNPDMTREKYGNNRYLVSNLLQWLNRDDPYGKWYIPQHPYDQAPTPDAVTHNSYINRPGFLHGFSGDFKQQLVTVSKTTVKNTVTDGGGSENVSSKVFLLSTTEVGFTNENNIVEGVIYEYFSKNNTNDQRLAYPSTYCLNNAGGYTNTNFAEGKGWYWWLRTPNSGDSFTERHVYLDGSLIHYDACYGHVGLRPAMVIKNYE